MSALPPVATAQLLVGRALPFGPNGEPSAIGKHPAVRPLRLTATGFEGDEQGDPAITAARTRLSTTIRGNTTPHGASNCRNCWRNDSRSGPSARISAPSG